MIKASVEAMMKTAMQSQLDGVRSGLTQLGKAIKDIHDVHNAMDEVDRGLKELPGWFMYYHIQSSYRSSFITSSALLMELGPVREETMKHSQLATARENLKHLFMVPETVKQTEFLIQEGRLLEAHKVGYYSIALFFKAFQTKKGLL